MFGLGDGLEAMSALSLLRDVANFFREIRLSRTEKAPRSSGRIEGGSDRLPLAIAARLGGRILYGAAVARIEQSERGVRVVFQRRGETGSLTADRLVSAIPFSVLRTIEIHPRFSPEKQRAIKELSLTSVTRVYVEADQRFWVARGESGRAETDLPIGPVRDETERQPGTGGILGVYATGPEARRLGALSDADRVKAVLADVARAHPGMTDHFVAGASKCWDTDPFARGAYSCMKPGQMKALLPHLARAEGRVHFAGDHTSYRPGFMHGALASAKRVVEEIAGKAR